MTAHPTLRIGMIGHGMMGVWHSQNLEGLGAMPHTIVGRREEAAQSFALAHGYANATTDLHAMLGDPEIDAVVVASPSEAHLQHSLAALQAGKHVLIEIPIAMDLAGAQRVAEVAARCDLVVAICHPWRHRPELIDLKERLNAGEERLNFLEGRFLIHRLENIGATGYQRSWTDSILWHHGAHLVDLAFWLMGPDVTTSGWLGPVDSRTHTPMTTEITLERPDGASAHLVLTYLSHLKHNEATATTERDSYRIDIPNRTMTTSAGSRAIETEQANCRTVLADFINACQSGHQPRVTPRDVLPCMAALQVVQDAWDARYGIRSLPGRTLHRLGHD